jgi:dinuclear metal center YbgI/SA1388 family protein
MLISAGLQAMLRSELDAYLSRYLAVDDFRDYCPNGLQVEGRGEVHAVVTGVTASLALIEAAIAEKADALIVHHGYFWKGEDPRIAGMRRRRIALLLRHDLNLFAFHLPLDAHASVGNNAALAQRLGLVMEGRFGAQDIAAHGRTAQPLTLAALGQAVEARLERAPLVIGDPGRAVRRVAWCTGAAQSYFEAAIGLGVDAFITGEVSEQTVHLERESGVGFIAAGHHATERYGVQALGAHLAAEFGVAHRFIDVDNPV